MYYHMIVTEGALIGGRQNILILITSMIIISQYWSYYHNIDHIILRSFLIISSHYQWSSRPAAGGSLLGIGSDVGGSLRIPAHFSGFVLSLFFHLSYLGSQRFSPLWNIWNIPSFSYFRLCWAEADHVSWFEEGNESNREKTFQFFGFKKVCFSYLWRGPTRWRRGGVKKCQVDNIGDDSFNYDHHNDEVDFLPLYQDWLLLGGGFHGFVCFGDWGLFAIFTAITIFIFIITIIIFTQSSCSSKATTL